LKRYSRRRDGRHGEHALLCPPQRARREDVSRAHAYRVRDDLVSGVLEAFDVDEVGARLSQAVPGGQRGKVVVPQILRRRQDPPRVRIARIIGHCAARVRRRRRPVLIKRVHPGELAPGR